MILIVNNNKPHPPWVCYCCKKHGIDSWTTAVEWQISFFFSTFRLQLGNLFRLPKIFVIAIEQSLLRNPHPLVFWIRPLSHWSHEQALTSSYCAQHSLSPWDTGAVDWYLGRPRTAVWTILSTTWKLRDRWHWSPRLILWREGHRYTWPPLEAMRNASACSMMLVHSYY